MTLRLLAFFGVFSMTLSLNAAPHPDWTVESISTASPLDTSLAFDPEGYPAVSFRDISAQSLVVARYNGTAWILTTVDSGTNVGAHSSLAFGPDGHPAISYYDDSNDDLKFARFNGTDWVKETIDATNNVGTHTSLVFNGSGNPTIAYEAVTNNDLKLAEFNGASWVITNVPVAGLIGTFASLAYNPAGEPTIAYYDSGAQDLEFVSRSTGTWTLSPVDTVGNVGRYASLAYATNGQPTIAYHDQTNGTLKFARYDGAVWQLETVDATAIVGTDASLAYNQEGQPAISYYDTTNSALKYAEFDGAAWQIITVTNDGSLGVFSSLAFAPDGQPSISFADSPTGVALATRTPFPKITWIGGPDGLWSEPANWSPRAPTAGDGVYIANSGSVVFDAGTATVAFLDVKGKLTLTGGTLTVTDETHCTTTGTIEITGGTLVFGSGEVHVAGTITIQVGGTLEITSGTISVEGGELHTYGMLKVTGGTIELEDDADTLVYSGGTWMFDGGSIAGDETTQVEVDGELKVEGGNVVIEDEVVVHDQGTVTITDGEVYLFEEMTVEGGGTLSLEEEGEMTVVLEHVVMEDESTLQGSGTLNLGGYYFTDTPGLAYILDSNGHILYIKNEYPPYGTYIGPNGHPIECPTFGATCSAGLIVSEFGYYVGGGGGGGSGFSGHVTYQSPNASVEGEGQLTQAMLTVESESNTLTVDSSGVYFPPNGMGFSWGKGGRWEVAVRDPFLPLLVDQVPGLDQIRTLGTLSVDATPEEPFIIALKTQSEPGTPGPLPSFDPLVPWTFPLVLTGVHFIANPQLNDIRVEVTGWLNDRARGHFGLEVQDDVNLNLVYTPAPWEVWLNQHFSEAERADPLISGPNANPDGDADSNIIEFLLNGDPHVFETSRLPNLTKIEEYSSYNLFLQPSQSQHGAEIILETSPDLITWSFRAKINAARDVEISTDYEIGHKVYPLTHGFRYELQPNFAQREFIRISATLQDPWWPLSNKPPAF